MKTLNAANKFFLQEHITRQVFHGGVGNIDIEKILLAEGFTPINFPGEQSFGVIAKLRRLAFLFSMLLLPRNSWLVYQFPQHAYLNRLLVKILLRRKSVRIICHLTDINGLKDGDQRMLKKEVALIRKHQYFIVHNQEMQDWLLSIHPGAKSASITFFDFLATAQSNRNHPKSKAVVFAGNLAKSSFLMLLPECTATANQQVDFILYGPGHQQGMNGTSITYKGIYEPYTLPTIIEGSWGLVWDGESITGLTGSLGEYMKYISHHKLSLYILAALPLIVPEDSAAASIARQFNIGIAVQSIDEIPFAIDRVSEEKYQQMILNMKALQPKINSGYFLKTALTTLMNP